MKPSRPSALVVTLAVIIALLTCALAYFARDELGLLPEEPADEGVPLASLVTVRDGQVAVHLDKQAQAASGLALHTLAPAHFAAATEVYGVVVDVQPLFDLRTRYLAATGETRALRAAAASSADEYQRLKGLFEDGRNASERAVLAAEAQSRGDQARANAAELSAASILDTVRATWGSAIAAWAIDTDRRMLDALAQQRTVLVQLAFPDELHGAVGRARVSVAPIAAVGERTRPAHFVSPAPRTDPTLRGATYFYTTSASGLRTGMRISGRVGLAAKRQAGVLVPESAIVWHGGKAWAYVKGEPDLFVRKEVSTVATIGNDWFDATHFSSGEEIVVAGAQLLLSEELKFQIRNENQD